MSLPPSSFTVRVQVYWPPSGPSETHFQVPTAALSSAAVSPQASMRASTGVTGCPSYVRRAPCQKCNLILGKAHHPVNGNCRRTSAGQPSRVVMRDSSCASSTALRMRPNSRTRMIPRCNQVDSSQKRLGFEDRRRGVARASGGRSRRFRACHDCTGSPGDAIRDALGNPAAAGTASVCSRASGARP